MNISKFFALQITAKLSPLYNQNLVRQKNCKGRDTDFLNVYVRFMFNVIFTLIVSFLERPALTHVTFQWDIVTQLVMNTFVQSERSKNVAILCSVDMCKLGWVSF